MAGELNVGADQIMRLLMAALQMQPVINSAEAAATTAGDKAMMPAPQPTPAAPAPQTALNVPTNTQPTPPAQTQQGLSTDTLGLLNLLAGFGSQLAGGQRTKAGQLGAFGQQAIQNMVYNRALQTLLGQGEEGDKQNPLLPL